jgi:AcrR family transcriptional regulator
MSKKNAILLAATQLIAQRGYNGASMAELSKMTGAAGGTIFHHFANKEELFLNILRNIKEVILSEFEKYMQNEAGKSGLKIVEDAITFYLHLAGTMEDQFLLLHRHFPYKMAEENLVCRQYLEAIYNCLLEIFERGITVGQEDGTIRQMPARNMAMILLSLVDGIARFNTYKMYNAGALYNDLIDACRQILKNEPVARK